MNVGDKTLKISDVVLTNEEIKITVKEGDEKCQIITFKNNWTFLNKQLTL